MIDNDSNELCIIVFALNGIIYASERLIYIHLDMQLGDENIKACHHGATMPNGETKLRCYSRGIVHNKIHLISPGCPQNITLQSRIVA